MGFAFNQLLGRADSFLILVPFHEEKARFVFTHRKLEIQSNVIMHGFCICEFTYELNFIHNLQVPISGAFVIIRGRVQSSKDYERPDVCVPREAD